MDLAALPDPATEPLPNGVPVFPKKKLIRRRSPSKAVFSCSIPIHDPFFGVILANVFSTSGVTRVLITKRLPGLTLTQAWTTVNALDTKVELDNSIANGLKAEIFTHFLPSTQAKGAKLNLHFKQPNFHARAFFDLLKGPTANLDAVLGHDGFLVGAEAGYDVQKAAITKYSAAIGYAQPEYSAAITATNNLSVFAASYYHKVNSQVEAGSKAIWDSKSSNNVGLEVAAKYRLDPTSFAKVCQEVHLQSRLYSIIYLLIALST
jgi:Eukaryotic porin